MDDYPGIDGFLPFRGSLMLDIVALAMVAIIPALGWSVYLVKYRRQYVWHKRLQLVLAGALLITVLIFETDMRLNGWQQRARPSPFFDTWVFPSLYVHLVFAVSTALLWIWVTVDALRKFENPPAPGAHSKRHVRWGQLAAIDMLCTAVTGWLFYWLAFVA